MRLTVNIPGAVRDELPTVLDIIARHVATMDKLPGNGIKFEIDLGGGNHGHWQVADS